MKADGHCLYLALSHQLAKINIEVSYMELRSIASHYMMIHASDYMPFLLSDRDEQLSNGNSITHS